MTRIQFYPKAIDGQDCVSNAWNLVTQKLWMYAGAGLVMIVLVGLIPIAGVFLMGPVMGGFYYIVLRDMRTEPVNFRMIFKGFDKFVPLMVAGVVQSIPGIVFQFIQYSSDAARIAGSVVGTSDSSNFFQQDTAGIGAAGGLSPLVLIGFSFLAAAWSLVFSFAIPLIIENEIGIADALKTSINAAVENIGGLVVLIILQTLVVLLGLLALCVGILVAIPVVYAAFAFAYRQVFPLGGSEMEVFYGD
jgi:Predicted integral membrane protein